VHANSGETVRIANVSSGQQRHSGTKHCAHQLLILRKQIALCLKVCEKGQGWLSAKEMPPYMKNWAASDIEIEAICRRYPLRRCDQHWTQSLLLIDYFRSDDRITPSSRRLRMIASHANTCARCGAEIEAGQRWIRAKVYEPVFAGNEPQYHRYHAEPFDGQELSCWERHLLQADRGRLAA
jgi:hypothetical protein